MPEPKALAVWFVLTEVGGKEEKNTLYDLIEMAPSSKARSP